MTISRELAIKILHYIATHPKFSFPFLVMCKEYSPEDDDFVEIAPNEWKNIDEDESYQTFELWENLQSLNKKTLSLMSKGFIEIIVGKDIKKAVKDLFKKYDILYKPQLRYSTNIEEFGTNEYLGGKREAFKDIIELLNKHNF